MHTKKDSTNFNYYAINLLMPFLVLISLLFPVKTNAIHAKGNFKDIDSINLFADDFIQKIITKNTSDSELALIVDFYKKMDVEVVFSRVKRNKHHEIIKIKTKVLYNGNKMEWEIQDNKVIEDFSIDAKMSNAKVEGMSFGKPRLKVGYSMLFESKDVKFVETDYAVIINDVKTDKPRSHAYGFNYESIIIQKNIGEFRDASAGAQLITALVNNSSIDINQALLFLNGNPITKANLDILTNEEALIIVVTEQTTATKKLGEMGKNGMIEVFQESESNTFLANNKAIQEILKTIKTTREELNIKPVKVTQFRMEVAENKEASSSNYDEASKNSLKVFTEKNDASQKESLLEKTEIIAGKEVTTRTIVSKSGILIKVFTTDNELAAYKTVLEKQKLEVIFSDVERNKFGILTGISITLKSDNEVVSEIWKTSLNENGIPDIFIGKINGKLSVSASK
jgi:hypothetical protein